VNLPKLSDEQVRRMAEFEDGASVTAGSRAMLRRFGHLPPLPSDAANEALASQDVTGSVPSSPRTRTLGRKAG